MLKTCLLLMLLAMPSWSHGEEPLQLNPGESTLTPLSDESLKWQCGCWYHVPLERGVNGPVMVNFDYASDSVSLSLAGEQRSLKKLSHNQAGNSEQLIFSNGTLRLEIDSELIRSGKYSSDYRSTLCLLRGAEPIEFSAFGSCGC